MPHFPNFVGPPLSPHHAFGDECIGDDNLLWVTLFAIDQKIAGAVNLLTSVMLFQQLDVANDFVTMYVCFSKRFSVRFGVLASRNFER